MFDNFIFKKKEKKCLIKNLHSIKMSKEAGNTSILKGILQNGLAYQGITNQLENHENLKKNREKKRVPKLFFYPWQLHLWVFSTTLQQIN